MLMDQSIQSDLHAENPMNSGLKMFSKIDKLELKEIDAPQGPHSQILMMRGSDRGSYFIPKKITASELAYPKKSLLFLAYPQKSLSHFSAGKRNPSAFFREQKKSWHLS